MASPCRGSDHVYEGAIQDLIDEKTARQSGEEQALRLLRDALGAEKIGEL